MSRFSATLLLTLSVCILASSVAAVQIYVGTTTLSKESDTCGDTQEFACIYDICDPAAGSQTGGRCRNGDASGTTCAPNDYCGFPTVGHCLENTISADGRHSMPANARNQGTDKHFHCLNVLNLDKPVIVWENYDCTGQSCFIPQSGYLNTWSIGAQANCVEINSENPINTVPCLVPGLASNAPFSGSYEQGHNVPSGGDYGFPQDFTQSTTCDHLPADTQGDPTSHLTDPPVGDFSSAYILNDDTNYDGGIIDRRDRSSRVKRATANDLTPARALRAAVPGYSDVFATTGRPWWFVTQAAALASVVARQSGLNVDHIVELETIGAYFTTDWQDRIAGITQDQWQLVSDFISSGGQHWYFGQCSSYQDFAVLCASPRNLQGIDNAVNALKNIVFAAVLPSLLPRLARATPHFSTTWTRRITQATLVYLQAVQGDVVGIAADIGHFVDSFVGTTSTQAVQNDFMSFVYSLWDQSITYLQDALANPDNFFKPG